MAVRKEFNSEALQDTYDRYIAGNPELEDFFEQALFETEVASLIYDLRTKSGLSQRALAKRVGTTASVICRLEDADYEGHSLAMLRRIAAALDKRVEIRFLPAAKPKRMRSRVPLHLGDRRRPQQSAPRGRRGRSKVA
jgi:transcriptional regulator with XRE-family HTH domain